MFRGSVTRSIVCLIAAWLVCALIPAYATNWYINGATGNNAWDGKASAWNGTDGPWKTFDHGSNTNSGNSILVQPGDTIYVAPGDYSTSASTGFTLAVSGSDSAGTSSAGDSTAPRITYIAQATSSAAPGMVILDGANSAGAKVTQTVVTVNGADITLNGFDIRNGTTSGLSGGANANNVLIENCLFHDNCTNGNSERQLACQAEDWVIKRNVFYNWASGGASNPGYAAAIYTYNCSGTTTFIYNNTFDGRMPAVLTGASAPIIFENNICSNKSSADPSILDLDGTAVTHDYNLYFNCLDTNTIWNSSAYSSIPLNSHEYNETASNWNPLYFNPELTAPTGSAVNYAVISSAGGGVGQGFAYLDSGVNSGGGAYSGVEYNKNPTTGVYEPDLGAYEVQPH